MAGFFSKFKQAAQTRIAEGGGQAVSGFFGGSLLGTALGNKWEKVFKPGEGEDPVKNETEKQSSIQSEVNSSLSRIETLVTNISDNIYNLAGIMGAQLTSMKEAERQAELRRSIEMAQQEENAAEASQALKPTAAATAPSDGQDGKSKGLIGGLLDRVKGLTGTVGKSNAKMGAFFKNFKLLGIGVLGAVGAAAAAGGLYNYFSSDKETPKSETTSSETEPADPEAALQASANIPLPPPSTTVQSLQGNVNSPGVTGQPPVSSLAAPATTTNEMGVTSTPVPETPVPQATPLPPAPVASPSPARSPSSADASPEDNPVRKIMYLKDVKKGLERQRDNGLSWLKKSKRDTPEAVERMRSKYDTQIKDIDKQINDLGQTSEAQQYMKETPSTSAPLIPSAIQKPAAEKGVELGRASVDVQTLSEQPKQASGDSTVVSENTTSGDMSRSPQAIPSPVADRGSLDSGVVFKQ